MSGAAVTLMKALFDVYEDQSARPPVLRKWSAVKFYTGDFDSASLTSILKALKYHTCCPASTPSCGVHLTSINQCAFEANGPMYYSYAGSDAENMTVVGELHKLAVWYTKARDAAGLHLSCGFTGRPRVPSTPRIPNEDQGHSAVKFSAELRRALVE